MFSASQSTSFSISITHTLTSKLGHTVLCVLHLISWKQNIKLKAKYWSSCAQKIGNFPLFLGHPIHFVDLLYICHDSGILHMSKRALWIWSSRDSMIVKIIKCPVFLSSIILPANCSLLNFCSKPQIQWGFLLELFKLKEDDCLPLPNSFTM